MAEPRRHFGPTVLVGLGSAALTCVAAARPWGTADAVVAGTHRLGEAKGTEVAPLALALGLVALAAWGTILVFRRRGRRIVAVIGLAASLGVLTAGIATADRIADLAKEAAGDLSSASSSTTAWFLVCLVAAAVTSVSFAAAWWLAPRWPEMAGRYDAPGGQSVRSAQSEQDLWKALDQGHDPTL